MDTAYIDVDGKWGVAIGYNLKPLDEYRVRDSLLALGLHGQHTETAIDVLFNYTNTGLCVSVPKRRMSLIFIGNAYDNEQFWDTLTHELYHATQDICEYYDVDASGEDGAWTIGYLIRVAVHQIAEPCI